MINAKTRSRIRGTIVGTAIGDALGMPVEGMSPAAIVNKYGFIRSMVTPIPGTWAQQTHRLNRGQWTDDTQLMLAIGESIVSKGFLDFEDIAQRHVLCLNDPRGWGRSTLTGIGKIKAGVKWWNSAAPEGAGNGTPMKIAPLGVLVGLNKIHMFEARTAVINISRMTHGDPRPAIAGILQMEAIADAIKFGVPGLRSALNLFPDRANDLEQSLDSEIHITLAGTLQEAVDMVRTGFTLSEIRDVIGAKSYVIESFPFTIAAVLKYIDSPETCLIELAAQGGDADTTCAMAGALLGAAHGLSSFPGRWRRPLECYTRLIALADGLCDKKEFVENTTFSPRPRISFQRSQVLK